MLWACHPPAAVARREHGCGARGGCARSANRQGLNPRRFHLVTPRRRTSRTSVRTFSERLISSGWCIEYIVVFCPSSKENDIFTKNNTLRRSVVGTLGEHTVAEWLRARGYLTNVNTKLPGSTDIEAFGTNVGLLVQVKSSAAPEEPAQMSYDEQICLVRRARNVGFQAWEARVQFDRAVRYVINIDWRLLWR